MSTTMILPFNPGVYTDACEKCGVSTMYRVEWVTRPEGWDATTGSMDRWKAEYAATYRHPAPETMRDEWLVLTCSTCRHSRAMHTADRQRPGRSSP